MPTAPSPAQKYVHVQLGIYRITTNFEISTTTDVP